MYVFTPKCGSLICHVLLTVQNTHRRALCSIHQQQTIYWIFTQTKIISIYRHKPIVTHWSLMKRQALQFRPNPNLQLLFFSLLVAKTLPISSQACDKWRSEIFEVLKRCYIEIYPTSLFALLWKSCKIFYNVKLRVE